MGYTLALTIIMDDNADMTKSKAPKETNKLAKFIVDIVTGEQKNPKQQDSNKRNLSKKNKK